jgi:hypothetical protein
MQQRTYAPVDAMARTMESDSRTGDGRSIGYGFSVDSVVVAAAAAGGGDEVLEASSPSPELGVSSFGSSLPPLDSGPSRRATVLGRRRPLSN